MAVQVSVMCSYVHTYSLRYPQHQTHLLPKSASLHFRISKKPTFYLSKPISSYPLITSSSTPREREHNGITNFISEKIIVLLVGSFIFMGSFSKKPVLAQPQHETIQNQSSDGFEEEETMYMKLLEDNPKNIEALKWVFHAKMKNGKTKESIQYVERLISIEPKQVEWRLLQALCYEMIGDLTKAKSLFKAILKQRPLLLRGLHGLAMVMHKNHEGTAVFEMLNKALEKARRKKRVTEERNIRILIAQMHVVKREFDDALKLLKDLIDENPRDFRPYLCQGIIYSLLDRKEEAEQQFSTYQRLLPDEFPQRGFLEDAVLAAKMELRQNLK